MGVLDTLCETLRLLQCPASYNDPDAGVSEDLCGGAGAAIVSIAEIVSGGDLHKACTKQKDGPATLLACFKLF